MHTIEELHQHYKAVRARLAYSAPAVAEPAKEPEPEPEPRPKKPPYMSSTQIIIWAVAQKHGLTVQEIVGQRRTQKCVRARFEAMYRIRTEQRKTLQYIGRFFESRDHTTVLHACRQHEKSIVS
jgi:chromosomal replication initiation ATPase DnaA